MGALPASSLSSSARQCRSKPASALGWHFIHMVAEAALESGEELFENLPVEDSVTYYFEQTDIDLDNLLKPILDEAGRGR